MLQIRLAQDGRHSDIGAHPELVRIERFRTSLRRIAATARWHAKCTERALQEPRILLWASKVALQSHRQKASQQKAFVCPRPAGSLPTGLTSCSFFGRKLEQPSAHKYRASRKQPTQASVMSTIEDSRSDRRSSSAVSFAKFSYPIYTG
jgi:hypothetical protein